MTERTKTLLVGVMAPVLTLVLTIGPIALFWGQLPDPMAASWDGSGVPKNPRSPQAFLAIQLVFALVSCALFVIGAFAKLKKPYYKAVAAMIAASLAPSFAMISIWEVRANRGVADWTQVSDPGTPFVISTIVASVVGVLAVAWLMRSQCRTTLPADRVEPTVGLSLEDSETASWSSQARARWPYLIAGPLVAIGLASIVGGVAGLGTPGVAMGAILIPSGLLALAFVNVLVSVDRRGLTVGYGTLPWPKTRISLDEIATVTSLDITPMEHGGWGYRGSRRIMGKAAVIVRGGEGIHLGLNDGTEFVVTVDNAAQGAGALNDLRRALVSR